MSISLSVPPDSSVTCHVTLQNRQLIYCPRGTAGKKKTHKHYSTIMLANRAHKQYVKNVLFA
jgi:hypothetical protein